MYSRFCDATALPMLADADTGFGNVTNVARAVTPVREGRRGRPVHRGPGVPQALRPHGGQGGRAARRVAGQDQGGARCARGSRLRDHGAHRRPGRERRRRRDRARAARLRRRRRPAVRRGAHDRRGDAPHLRRDPGPLPRQQRRNRALAAAAGGRAAGDRLCGGRVPGGRDLRGRARARRTVRDDPAHRHDGGRSCRASSPSTRSTTSSGCRRSGSAKRRSRSTPKHWSRATIPAEHRPSAIPTFHRQEKRHAVLVHSQSARHRRARRRRAGHGAAADRHAHLAPGAARASHDQAARGFRRRREAAHERTGRGAALRLRADRQGGREFPAGRARDHRGGDERQLPVGHDDPRDERDAHSVRDERPRADQALPGARRRAVTSTRSWRSAGSRASRGSTSRARRSSRRARSRSSRSTTSRASRSAASTS